MSQNPIPSPCVDVCALDANDICTGCYRSGDEISLWWALSDVEKKEVYKRIARREKQAGVGPNNRD